MKPSCGWQDTIFVVCSSPSSFGVCNELTFVPSWFWPNRIFCLKNTFTGVLFTRNARNLCREP